MALIHGLCLSQMPAPSRVTSRLWRPPRGFQAFTNTLYPHSLHAGGGVEPHAQTEKGGWPGLQAPESVECGSVESVLCGAVCRRLFGMDKKVWKAQ